MKNDFLVAVAQLSAERHLTKEMVLELIEQALVLAYKRNYGAAQNIAVRIDPSSGKARVYVQKEVVDDVKDPRMQLSLAEARRIDAGAQVGKLVEIETTPKSFGRIAAQTAKQVLLQRIREAERDSIYADWSDRLGEIVLGRVRNIDSGGNVILSLGSAEAIMPRSEQISTEQYGRGEKVRAYVYEVEKTNRGPRIRVSRTHRKLLGRLLESEVPEIFNGIVEVKAIAREAGSRSKVAVVANQEGVDPVGSCVGMRGVRIQNIVNELGGEKIDIVQWAPEEVQFIANALSPAKVEHVWLDSETRTATVVVPDTQLSLAIGKEGQNARLAAKLTNWRIDIKSVTDAAEETERRAREAAEAAEREAELAAKREAAAELLAAAERSLIEEEAAAQEAPAVPTPELAETMVAAEEAAEAVPAVELPSVGVEQPAVEEAVVAAGEEPSAIVELPKVPEEALPVQPAADVAVAKPSTELELVTAGELAVEDSDEDEEYDREEQELRKKGRKHRGRELVLDEGSGMVISRKRRKKSRSRPDWKDFEDH